MHHWKKNVVVRAALVSIAVCGITAIVSFQMEYNRLKTTRDELAAQIALTEEHIEELQNALDEPFDDDYVIRFAREKLNYRLPEEIVFYNDLNH